MTLQVQITCQYGPFEGVDIGIFENLSQKRKKTVFSRSDRMQKTQIRHFPYLTDSAPCSFGVAKRENYRIMR